MLRAARTGMGIYVAMAACFGQTPPQSSPPQSALPQATFGVTVIDTTGLEGKVYLIKHNSTRLPNFDKLKPKGSIYTPELNIPARDFEEGFPGVTDRFEWFAIDYSGRFWIEQPGAYHFALTSDDGSRLYIDDRLAINNDGVHPPNRAQAGVRLARGVHRIRVSYFQGPRFQVALVLEVAGPDEQWRIFNTKDFRPADPDDWSAFAASDAIPARRKH